MDNSKLDLYLLFHDDPELLSLLENPPADAVWTPMDQPPDPPVPAHGKIDGAGSFPSGPPAGEAMPEAASLAAGEDEWRLMLEELDQLVADASGPPKPELPPPKPGGAQTDPFSFPGFDHPLSAHGPFTFSDPLAQTGGEDGGPLVFEKATPFDEEDPLSRPSFYEGMPFPYGGQADEDFFSDRAGQARMDPQEEEQEEEQGEERGEASPPRAKRVAGVVFNVIFFLLCFALVAGSAIFAFSGNQQKSYLGFRFFNVLSQSMAPQPDSPPGGFYPGDIIVVRVVEDASAINRGDIITIRQPADNSKFLTHRVIDITSKNNGQTGLFFITKGDSNNSNDPPVSADLLVGKVVLVLPKMGTFLDYVRANLVLVIIFIVALFAFSILLRGILLSNAKAKRRKGGKSNLNTSERSTTK